MYQLRISAPLKIVKNVPITKNGANGTLVFAFTFFIERKAAADIPPIKYDITSATKNNCQPNNAAMPSPMYKSPSPNHSPLERNICPPKNSPAIMAAITMLMKSGCPRIMLVMNEIAMNGNRKISGISRCLRS